MLSDTGSVLMMSVCLLSVYKDSQFMLTCVSAVLSDTGSVLMMSVCLLTCLTVTICLIVTY